MVIEASKSAVTANELALEGVRAENTVGTRNVLDVLNAEQELLNSRVQLVTAERDAYVAGFTLLAAMGRAEARDLLGPIYNWFTEGFDAPDLKDAKAREAVLLARLRDGAQQATATAKVPVAAD